MVMLEVPDFQSVKEFRAWAKAQKSASIRQWRTSDWLKVYEKMDALALKNPAIVKQAKDENRRKREVFVEKTCLELGHLYKNYRFEEEHYRIICQKAVETGKQFAQVAEENSLDSAMLVSQLNIGKKSRHGNQQAMGAQIASIVQKTSALEEDAVGLEIDDKLQSIGVQNSAENKISVNSLATGDVAIDTWFHEAAHAYLQVSSDKQVNSLEKHEFPIPELGENFYRLMLKNGLYYLDTDCLQKRASQQNVSRMSERNFFLMYTKQPVEKYSELFGLMAERSYRRETGHVSERAAMKIAQKLLWSVGRRPREAWYDDKNGRIVLRYGRIDAKSETSGQGVRIQEALRCNFSSLDEESLRRLNLHIDEGNCVQISVPTNPKEAAALMRKMDDLSLRTAMKIAEKLRQSVGRRPREAWYDDKNGRIVLRYGKIDAKSETSWQGARIQEALRCNFSSLDEKSLRKLNLHIDEGNCVQISVPTNPKEVAVLMRKMDDLSFWESAEKRGFELMNMCDKKLLQFKNNLAQGQERLERRFGMIAKLKEAKKKIATKLTQVEQKQSGSR